MKIIRVATTIIIVSLLLTLIACEQKTSTVKKSTTETYCPPGSYYCPPAGTTTNTWNTYPTPTPYVTPTAQPVATFPPNQSDTCDDIWGIDKPTTGSGFNLKPWCFIIKRHGGTTGSADGWDTFHNYPATWHTAFITDATFKVKVTANSAPNTCDVSPVYLKAYGELKFDLGISADGGQTYFYPMADTYLKIGESKVFDLSSYINKNNCTGDGLCKQFVRIENVRSDHACTLKCPGDSQCQYFCPAEWKMPSQSCWGMRLQISTDYHQDFAP